MWALAHERRATPPGTKRTASLRAAGKMADWCVERLGRIADTPFAFLLPFSHFSTQRDSSLREKWGQTSDDPKTREQRQDGQHHGADHISGSLAIFAPLQQ